MKEEKWEDVAIDLRLLCYEKVAELFFKDKAQPRQTMKSATPLHNPFCELSSMFVTMPET